MKIAKILTIAFLFACLSSFASASSVLENADHQDWSSFVLRNPDAKLVRASTDEKKGNSNLIVEFSSDEMSMFIYAPTNAQDTEADIAMSGTFRIDEKPAGNIKFTGQVTGRTAFYTIDEKSEAVLMQEMGQGRYIRFTINPVFGGKPINVTYSLAGFNASITRALGLCKKHFGSRRY